MYACYAMNEGTYGLYVCYVCAHVMYVCMYVCTMCM